MNIIETTKVIVIYCILLWCFIFSFSSASHFFYKGDTDKKIIRKFIITKGFFYLVLAVAIIIYDGIYKVDLSITSLLTICLAIFETAQNIMQAKAEGYFEKVNKIMKNIEMGDIKKVEILYRYCNQKMELLRTNATISNKKLIYEQIYDYLKYYQEAKEFLETFRLYIVGKKELEDVIKAESLWYEDFKYECIEIVKLPEVY